MPDLRTRIGLASAVVADRVPQARRSSTLVLTASYGILGRAAEAFDSSWTVTQSRRGCSTRWAAPT